MWAVVVAPAITVMVKAPLSVRYREKKNWMRNKVLAVNAAVMEFPQFSRLQPAFDMVLEELPEWEIPEKYKTHPVLINIFVLQNMGICQCALLAIFEPTAITTKIAALVTFFAFPVMWIVYTYITLKAVMRPEARFISWGPFAFTGGMKYWDFAQNVLLSIPGGMSPGDVKFKPSIPPILKEKPIPMIPRVPPGTGPIEAKAIMQEAYEHNKAMVADRLAAIQELGPEAVQTQGKWTVDGGDAESWYATYGPMFETYNHNGYLLVAVDQIKRLSQMVLLAGLSTAPWLGPLQVRLLTALGMVEWLIVAVTRPYSKHMVNLELFGTNGTKLSQMLAPILLMRGFVEDQFVAMFMMACNTVVNAANQVKEWINSFRPTVEGVLGTIKPTITAVMAVSAMVMLYYWKIKSVVDEAKNIKPLPPVWKLIKMTPVMLALIGKMTNETVMDRVHELVADVQPLIDGYSQAFEKIAQAWMDQKGAEVLATQFAQVLNPEHPRQQVSLEKYIRTFHKLAASTVFRAMKPQLKTTAQSLFNTAMAEAKQSQLDFEMAVGGNDPNAAAKLVLSPNMVCGFEHALSTFGEIRTTWLTYDLTPCERLVLCAEKSLKQWRKSGGDAEIEAAIEEIQAAIGKENYPPAELVIPVQVPVTLLMRNAVVKAGKRIRKDLRKLKDGELDAQLAMIDLDPDLPLMAMRREYSKLAQIIMLRKAREVVVPKLLKQIEKLGLPNRVQAREARDVTLHMAEAMLRRTMHERVCIAFEKVTETLKMPDCGVKITDTTDEDEDENEFGYALSETNYTDLLPRFGLALQDFEAEGNELVAEVNVVLDPARQVIHQLVNSIQPWLAKYKELSTEAAKHWEVDELLQYEKDAAAAAEQVRSAEQQKLEATLAKAEQKAGPDPKKSKIDALTDKRRKLEMALEAKVMAHHTKMIREIKIPLHMFHKHGLAAALGILIPLVKGRGCQVVEFLDAIALPSNLLELNSSDMRRAFDRLAQEYIVDKAYRDIFPQLDDTIQDLGLSKELDNTLRGLVYEQAEDKIRMGVHDLIGELYDNMSFAMQKRLPVPVVVHLRDGQKQNVGTKLVACGVEMEPGNKTMRIVRVETAVEEWTRINDAAAEDDFGWDSKKGGWKKEKHMRRKASPPVSPGSAVFWANTVVSPDVVQELRCIADCRPLSSVQPDEMKQSFQQSAPLWKGLDTHDIIKTYLETAIREHQKSPSRGPALAASFHAAGLKAALALVLSELPQEHEATNVKTPDDDTTSEVDAATAKVRACAEALRLFDKPTADPKTGLETPVHMVGELRRALSRVLGEIVMLQVTVDVFPCLENLVIDLGVEKALSPRVIADTKSQVYRITEEVVRRHLNDQVLSTFMDIQAAITPPNGSKLEDADSGFEVRKYKGEDPYGFDLGAGGLAKHRRDQPLGGGADEYVRAIFNAATLKQIDAAADTITPFLQEYQEAAMGLKKQWVTGDGTELLAACQDRPKRLKKIVVPCHQWNKAALLVATKGKVKVKAESMEGKSAAKAAAILDHSTLHSTDLRRQFDSLCQEVVVQPCQAKLFPQLDVQVTKMMDKYPQMRSIEESVRRKVEDTAEGTVRKLVHARVLDIYGDVIKALVVDGTTVADEPGEAQPEDEYGALLSEGGWRPTNEANNLDRLKATAEQHAQEIVDESIATMLDSRVAHAEEYLRFYKDDAMQSLAKKWTNVSAQELNQESSSAGHLRVQYPRVELHKSSLKKTILKLKPKMAKHGGESAARAARVRLGSSQGITDLRRELSQCLQQFIMDEVESDIFIQIDELIAAKKLPKKGAMKRLRGETKDACYRIVDDYVRQQIHRRVLLSFDSVETEYDQAKDHVPDCEEQVELVLPRDEDKWGMLVSEGGYDMFKRREVLGKVALVAAAAAAKVAVKDRHVGRDHEAEMDMEPDLALAERVLGGYASNQGLDLLHALKASIAHNVERHTNARFEADSDDRWSDCNFGTPTVVDDCTIAHSICQNFAQVADFDSFMKSRGLFWHPDPPSWSEWLNGEDHFEQSPDFLPRCQYQRRHRYRPLSTLDLTGRVQGGTFEVEETVNPLADDKDNEDVTPTPREIAADSAQLGAELSFLEKKKAEFQMYLAKEAEEVVDVPWDPVQYTEEEEKIMQSEIEIDEVLLKEQAKISTTVKKFAMVRGAGIVASELLFVGRLNHTCHSGAVLNPLSAPACSHVGYALVGTGGQGCSRES
eukprot:COSAG02_NODE_1217_length_13824_cov_14.009180_4_plen_2211_part_00